MLSMIDRHEITNLSKLEKLELHMLNFPQVECPVIHHFGPGIYIREVTLQANTFAIGHAQRHAHSNIMLTGSVAMITNDSQIKTLKAPLIFIGQPGRKVGYVIETCTWHNIYPNPDDERDIDILETKWLDKSDSWQTYEAAKQLGLIDRHDIDRIDFLKVAEQSGFSVDKIRAQSENLDDQISMPEGFARVTIRQSPIEGRGIFLSCPAQQGELIGPARINGMRTPLGRYTNHSCTPNALFVKQGGDIYLYASRPILGCAGGNQGEEITVDYRQALSLSGIHLGENQL